MVDIVYYLRSENISDLAGLFELAIGTIWVLSYLVFAKAITVRTRKN